MESSTSIAPLNSTTNTSIPNKDIYLAQIDNTIAAIEDQNLTHDVRYTQLNILKTRLKGSKFFFFNLRIFRW